jgi:phospholipid transport system substrate-binding protein
MTIKSGLSLLAYRCMQAMRVLSPYLFAAIFVALAPSARAATPAENFVQLNIEKGTAILNDATLNGDQRVTKFRALLLNIMDAKRVALFTLGAYARGAKDADIQVFSNSFADFVVALLQHDLAGNPGETISVTGSFVRAPDDVLVTVKLTGSVHTNGTPVNMSFRVRKNAGGADTLVDLQVEGVSMAMAQRSDFTAWLQQHHGDIRALGKELQLRARDLRELDANPQAARTVSALAH